MNAKVLHTVLMNIAPESMREAIDGIARLDEQIRQLNTERRSREIELLDMARMSQHTTQSMVKAVTANWKEVAAP